MQGLVGGRFELLAPLGAGSFARVFRARDVETGEHCAVKLLDGETPSETSRGRFDREVDALAAVHHPAIVRTLAHGVQGSGKESVPWIAMELLAGRLLAEWAPAERPAKGAPGYDAFARTGARLIGEIAAALGSAHAAGVVHRDLSARNIVVTGDEPPRARLFDFGLARLADSDRLTKTGTVLGTAHTLAPEQARGLPPGPPADVYSLGCVLFDTLTGRAPFPGDSLMAVLVGHIEGRVPDARAIEPRCPGPLARLIARMLAKEPDTRPPACEVADVLAREAVVA